MKYSIKFFILLNIIIAGCNAVPLTGHWEAKKQIGMRTDHQPSNFYAERLSYRKGGLTFTYPKDYFASEPCVYVTIELKGLRYSSDLIISPVIKSSTSNNVTVYIHKEEAGYLLNSIDEADSDDVYVHLFALGF